MSSRLLAGAKGPLGRLQPLLQAQQAQTRSYAAPVGNAIPAAKKKYVPTSGTYPVGFRVGGVVVGVKPGNTTKPDLALVVSDVPCAAAAVFTKNTFQAAPVTYSKGLLTQNGAGEIQSVVINSGCANAVTGKGGLEDAAAMAKATDACVGNASAEKTLVMSTGVIGQRLPIQKILDGVPTAFETLGSTHAHWLTCARAICTTDTFPKLLSREFTLPSAGPDIKYRIAGTTKGAGMIHPNMATLLGVVATDAPIATEGLKGLLQHAVDKSFNSISIDGDTSTNDTVALLANGLAGGPAVKPGTKDYETLQTVLDDFATALAQLVVRDGEGATKFITVRVVDAASQAEARRVASVIARSPLVKTALYGKDANWGRILCATGYSLVSEPGTPETATPAINPNTTSVSFVPSDGSAELKLLVNGEPETVDETRAAQILELEDQEILVRLGTGKAEATYWTCDFSHEYVTINGDYRT